jgi:hypothetical protein
MYDVGAWFFNPSFDRRYLDIYPTILRILLGIEELQV